MAVLKRLFGSVALGAMIAGCRAASIPSDGTIPGLGSAAATPDATGDAGFKSLYSFEGSPDGRFPKASLIAVAHTLYGTTYSGGSGVGTVFKTSRAGRESVFYRFGEQSGAYPRANVIALNDGLYGMTYLGGPNDCGTIYLLGTGTTIGDATTLHDFNCTDGGRPYGALLQIGSNVLYGTTSLGGTGTKCSSAGCGTIFALSIPSGEYRVVYSFNGGADGSYPSASLIAVGDLLYGTTAKGGNECSCGTVFALDPSSGKHRVIYRFEGGKDGDMPMASLVAFKGRLYGTTVFGGVETRHCKAGCGTVFAVTLVPHAAAKERIVHRFTGGKDGAAPRAALINVRGVLYGTTAGGGERNSCSGCGTVFQVDASGEERVLHTFAGEDGKEPDASLVEVNGALYGTTERGGEHCPFDGCGTVFTLRP